MKPRTIINLIGSIEVAIAMATMFGLFYSLLLARSTKPANVFVFVLASASVSLCLGMSLFFLKGWARYLLVFFSGYVILTKVLVFMNILQLEGEMITSISNPAKNTISILYHLVVIIALLHPSVKRLFSS